MPREKNDSSEGLGDRIRRLRLARDWKQEDLADAADVSKSLISEAENGAQPRGPHLVRIAAALGASLDYLLTGREPAPLATRSRLEVPEELAAVAKRLELP